MEIPFCSFCLQEDRLHNEAIWVIEVVTPDAVVYQRALACFTCGEAAFTDTAAGPAQFENGNTTILRRWCPGDAVLSVDGIGDAED